jgi:hypothetical protein
MGSGSTGNNFRFFNLTVQLIVKKANFLIWVACSNEYNAANDYQNVE